jgi:hypothetical protein
MVPVIERAGVCPWCQKIAFGGVGGVLAVRDLAASKKFYLEKLGFAEDFSVDGWAFLSRGACKLRLGHWRTLAVQK